MRSPTILIALLFTTTAATASMVEDAAQDVAPGFHYQEDGAQDGDGNPLHSGDAPDSCEEVEFDRGLFHDGGSVVSVLVPHDDVADAFAYDLPDEMVTGRVSIALQLGDLTATNDVVFDVYAPGCGEDVLDPESTYYDYDESRIPPADPVEAGPGEVLVEMEGDALVPTQCDDGKAWDMWLKSGKHRDAWPQEAYFQWSDGTHAYIDIDVVNQRHAQFQAFYHPYTLEYVAIAFPVEWDGEIQWLKGPCDAQVGQHEFMSKAPSDSGHYAEFDVREEGTYVVVISIERDAAQKVVDKTQEGASAPSLAQRAECNYGTCRAYNGNIDLHAFSDILIAP